MGLCFFTHFWSSQFWVKIFGETSGYLSIAVGAKISRMIILEDLRIPYGNQWPRTYTP